MKREKKFDKAPNEFLECLHARGAGRKNENFTSSIYACGQFCVRINNVRHDEQVKFVAEIRINSLKFKILILFFLKRVKLGSLGRVYF